MAYLKWSLWKIVMISDSQCICSFSKQKAWDDEDCKACLSHSYDKDMLWKCAHIVLYCTSKYLHGCIQFSASAAVVANTFLQIVKIIVWIIAFFLINIISQSPELSCLGLFLKNVWITLFLQNQLFWGHSENLCYDSTESFDWGKEGPVI